ncbi:MAG: dienelactone hydrolase family protein [Gammaproteobacteria bacterium]|nr:dienelactone hydrolase family protein [Gammaproteobacteria bacterium]
MSKTVTIPSHDGSLFSAYLALPKTEKSNGMLLIVLQEVYGVNHAIREVCDNFAKQGFIACAPDLFWRIKPYLDLNYDEKDREIAMSCYQQFNIPLALHDIQSTIRELKKRKDLSGKIGVIGFGLGGKLAYLFAAEDHVDVAISYYGGGIHEHLDLASRITQPAQFHFGGDDAHILTKHVAALQDAMKDKSNIEIYVYPDAEHAFSNPDRPSYHKFSADEANTRVLALLKKIV